MKQIPVINAIVNRKTNLWIVPLTGAVLAAITASVTLYIDRTIDLSGSSIPLFEGTPDSARTLLSVIAGSVTTLLALIFTIIVVAVQLASSQYSPRTLSTLLQDRPSHLTIGVFVGTITYTLIVLLGLNVIEPDVERDTISGVSLTFAFILALVSLGTFSAYSNHMIHSVRITSLINRVGQETRESIEKIYTKPFSKETSNDFALPGSVPDKIIHAKRLGFFNTFDEKSLLKAAVKHNAVLKVIPVIGAFVPQGAPLIEVYGEDPGNIEGYIYLEKERTMKRNITFGLRELTDMAIRATSTGINDPATSVQVLEQLYDLSRRLLLKDLFDYKINDENGTPRLMVKMPSWQDFVIIIFDENRINGASSLQVARYMRAMLINLIDISPAERKESLEQQLRLLDQSVNDNFAGEHDKKLALAADIKGTGF
jgi:uncharacterized membrane protein